MKRRQFLKLIGIAVVSPLGMGKAAPATEVMGLRETSIYIREWGNEPVPMIDEDALVKAMNDMAEYNLFIKEWPRVEA